MNLATIPLLLVSLLLMMAGDQQVEAVHVLTAGRHIVTHDPGALVVAEASAEIPAGSSIAGPVYQVGGTLTIAGEVRGDVVQLAGTLRIGEEARIGDELRSIGGRQTVAPGSAIGRRSEVEMIPAERSPGSSLVTVGGVAGLLALVGFRLAGRRPAALANVAGAVRRHPVIVVTVGVLVTLTGVAVVVFMGFTLVLIPVAVAGLVAGGVVLGYGVIALGHLAGRHLPGGKGGPATAAGVAAVVVGTRLLGLVPLVGDLLALGVLMAGVGAVVVTYFGVVPFRPVELPGES